MNCPQRKRVLRYPFPFLHSKLACFGELTYCRRKSEENIQAGQDKVDVAVLAGEAPSKSLLSIGSLLFAKTRKRKLRCDAFRFAHLVFRFEILELRLQQRRLCVELLRGRSVNLR